MRSMHVTGLTALLAAAGAGAVIVRPDDVGEIGDDEPILLADGPLVSRAEPTPKVHTHSREIARRMRQEARRKAKDEHIVGVLRQSTGATS